MECLGVGSNCFLKEFYISRATRRASEITKGAWRGPALSPILRNFNPESSNSLARVSSARLGVAKTRESASTKEVLPSRNDKISAPCGVQRVIADSRMKQTLTEPIFVEEDSRRRSVEVPCPSKDQA